MVQFYVLSPSSDGKPGFLITNMYQKSKLTLRLLFPKPWTNQKVTVDLHTHIHTYSFTHTSIHFHSHSLEMVSGAGEGTRDLYFQMATK